MERLETSNQSHDGTTNMYPFICGICSLKSDDLGLFLRHFRTHSRISLPRSNFHICSCLLQDADNVGEDEANVPYNCRSCMKKFYSICKLHSHLVNCSKSNGSYILDNNKKMVYPLSLHCSNFENRENDMCETVEADHVKVNENSNLNHKEMSVNWTERNFSPSDSILNPNDKGLTKDLHGNVRSDMRYTQQVDHILTCVCKLFENDDARDIEKVESIDSIKKGKEKKTRPSNKTRTKKIKKRRDKNFNKSVTVSVGEENDVKKIEGKSEEVIIKIEVEENKVCNESSDINIIGNLSETKDNMGDLSKSEDNFGMSLSVSSYMSNDNNHFGDKNDDCNNDVDDDDLTDEYTQDGLEMDGKLIQKENRSRETEKNSLKHTKIKNEVNKHKVYNKSKKIRKSTEKIVQKKRGCSEKAAVECPHCGKFLKPYKMKVHLVSHMEDRPFQCDLCPKSYKYSGHLESHKASHQDVKPFYCEICGKGFITHTVLRHHSMMHHSDSKPCVCNICGASFITNYKLKRHMTKHTGEKSVQCDLCGMGFSTRYNLSVHIQGVHKRDHRFTCAQCGKNFMTNYQLKVHTMKHSGERPYKCSICKAEYIERKELRRHMKKQHNLQLEENTNALTELMGGYDISKVMSAKDMPQLSVFEAQSHDQIMEQTETSSAADYITAGNENMYSYTTTDMCTSAPYYSAIKKIVPQNEYQMIYENTQEFSYNNSQSELTLPLTVQEMHDSTKYHSSIHETCSVKDSPKTDEEKVNLNGNTQHHVHLSKHLMSMAKQGNVVTPDKMDENFTSL